MEKPAYGKDNLLSFDNPHILDSSNINSLEFVLLAIVGCQAGLQPLFSISVRLKKRYLTVKSLGGDKTC